MKEDDLNYLLNMLDGSGSDQESKAVKSLGEVGNKLPSLLLKKYRSEKKWQARSSCVYHSIRYAKDVDDAFKLGIEAVCDKSKVVRYRACMLLAYSLNRGALLILNTMLSNDKYKESYDDIRAAINSIENQNSNYFVDRDHSGKVTLRVH